MHLLRPLLATLAISLTLPLSAAPEEKTVYKDTEPYVCRQEKQRNSQITYQIQAIMTLRDPTFGSA